MILGVGGRKLSHRAHSLWMDTRSLDIPYHGIFILYPHIMKISTDGEPETSSNPWRWRQQALVWSKDMEWATVMANTDSCHYWVREKLDIFFIRKKVSNYATHPVPTIHCRVRRMGLKLSFSRTHLGNCLAESTKTDPIIPRLGIYPTEICVYVHVKYYS